MSTCRRILAFTAAILALSSVAPLQAAVQCEYVIAVQFMASYDQARLGGNQYYQIRKFDFNAHRYLLTSPELSSARSGPVDVRNVDIACNYSGDAVYASDGLILSKYSKKGSLTVQLPGVMRTANLFVGSAVVEYVGRNGLGTLLVRGGTLLDINGNKSFALSADRKTHMDGFAFTKGTTWNAYGDPFGVVFDFKTLPTWLNQNGNKGVEITADGNEEVRISRVWLFVYKLSSNLPG